MILPVRPFLFAFGGACAAMLMSFAVHRLPSVQGVAALALVAVGTFCYRRSFATGTAVILAELVAGSLGRSFVLPWGGVSVRMLLFAIALAATLVHLIRHRATARVAPTPVTVAFGLVTVAVGWGIVRGLALHPLGAVVADANAYLYLLLAPTFLIALREEADRRMLLSVLLGAATAVAVQTLAVFFLATQGLIPTTTHPLYKWIRDAGFGELTPGAGGFARIFLQSHLWSAVTVLLAPGLYVLARAAKKDTTGDPTLGNRFLVETSAVLSAAVLFISLSRSFWLSTAGAAVLGILLVVLRRNLRSGATTFIVSLAVFTALGIAIPYSLSRSVGTAVSGRVSVVAGEPAADSRVNLLRVMWPAVRQHPVLGSGFGTALTYETRDPRLLAYFPDGRYTTSAFEWGWLDFWLKMGIMGPVAFAALVGSVLWTCWRALRGPEPWVALGMFLAVLMVSAAHMLSPWLNHPLGIGLVLVAMGAVSGMSRTQTTASPG